MAKIDLRPWFVGSGLSGTIDYAPTLSWLDSQALTSTAMRTAAIADDLEALRRGVYGAAGIVPGEIVHALAQLEEQLGLRLEQQTEYLKGQLTALGRLEETLRHPAQVRAAERVEDAIVLISFRRFERALPLIEEAIADDPLNPAAFSTAGWVLIGLDRLDDAAKMFAEGALAAEGAERAKLTRQAARLDLAQSRRDQAVAAIRHVLGEAIGVVEKAACLYDLAVYLAEDDQNEAIVALQRAFKLDARYALMAAADPIFSDSLDILSAALRHVESLRDLVRDESEILQRRVDDIHRELVRLGIDANEPRHQFESDLTDERKLRANEVIDELQRASKPPPSDELLDVQLGYLRVRMHCLEERWKELVEAVEQGDDVPQDDPRLAEVAAAIARREAELKAESERIYAERDRCWQELHEIVNNRKRHKMRREEERARALWTAAEAKRDSLPNLANPDTRLQELKATQSRVFSEIEALRRARERTRLMPPSAQEAIAFTSRSEVERNIQTAEVSVPDVRAAHRISGSEDPIAFVAMAHRSDSLREALVDARIQADFEGTDGQSRGLQNLLLSRHD